ncbi:glutamate--tRNA ligase [Myxococcota bacterium]|nr:glutamate--tRNA ligase [Myxococcota bacterium]
MGNGIKVGVGGAQNLGNVNQVEAGAPAQVEAKKGRGAIEPQLAPLSLEDIKKLSGDEVRAPKKPRFRFAPSPTGHLHIGGARTALMNYLAAQKMGGEFVLRIEDTDQLRSKPEYTEAIKKGLEWLGIQWTGDIVFQSQRTKLYQEKVQKLVDEGKAYKDATGAIFFKMPEEGSLVVNDRVKGRVTISITESDGNKDFVIQRSDGSPMFLLANVVDDGEMGITHVIRGDDHLTNAARQICLFRALGYDVPEFYHVPLIHGDDGAKLSKRHGAQSVIDYQDQGYDAKVLVNHLARLGMNYGTDATLEVSDLAKRFDPLGFSKSRSLLGLDKLAARGLMYIRGQEPAAIMAEIQQRTAGDTVRVHLEDGSIGDEPNLLKNLSKPQLEALSDGARSRASTFMEAVEIGQFIRKPAVYGEDEAKLFGQPKLKALVGKLLNDLRAVPAEKWDLKTLDGVLSKFNEQNKVGYKMYGNPLRWMLTGVQHGLPLHHTMVILGRDEALNRLAERTA